MTHSEGISNGFIQYILREGLLCARHSQYPTARETGCWPVRGKGQGLPVVTSRTSLRTSTMRNQCRSCGKPSSSALRSCRATFFLQDSCRLKYFTSLLCKDTDEDTSQRHCREGDRQESPRCPLPPQPHPAPHSKGGGQALVPLQGAGETFGWILVHFHC